MNAYQIVTKCLKHLRYDCTHVHDWPFLPQSDECVDRSTPDGWGIRAVEADEFNHVRRGFAVPAFLPLVNWYGPYLSAYFGVYVIACSGDVVGAVFTNDPFGGVILCHDLQFAFLAFIGIAETDYGVIEREEDQAICTMIRQRYWSRYGAELSGCLPHHGVDHQAWCFGQEPPWGIIDGHERAMEIPSYGVSMAARYWQEGKIRQAQSAIEEVCDTASTSLAHATWIRSMCSMIRGERVSSTQLHQALDGCDWLFGRMTWSSDPAWDVPLELVVANQSDADGPWSAKMTLERGRDMLRQGVICGAWSMATLVSRAAWAGMADAVNHHDEAITLMNACLVHLNCDLLLLANP